MQREFIINCDEDGTLIGPLDRKIAHRKDIAPLLCHKVVWAMLYCKNTKRWCLQKKLSKSINVEIWDTSIGGHCCYAENFKYMTPEENMRKEAYEELGLKDYELILVDKQNVKTSYSNEFVYFYLLITENENVVYTDGEVLEHKWIKDNEFEKFCVNNRISHALEMTYFKCKSKIDSN